MPEDEAVEMGTQMADVYPNIAKLIPVATTTHDGPVVTSLYEAADAMPSETPPIPANSSTAPAFAGAG